MSDATQGLMTTDTPYALESYGQGLQIMCEGECVLDTNVLKREQAEAVVRLMNEAFQFGFHRCSVELSNEVEVR